MKGKVLIVEDEILIAGIIKKYVGKAGFTCMGMAVDYDEAIEFLENELPDILLLDINISGKKSGIELAKYVKQEYNLPYIFITSYSDEKTIEEIKETYPAGYISKPINEINLLATLEIVLHNTKENQHPNRFIEIKDGKTTYRINVDNLLYIKAEHVYVQIVLTNERIVVRNSLKNILSTMSSSLIHQINRSVAINKNYITKINAKEVEIGNEIFTLGRTFKSLL